MTEHPLTGEQERQWLVDQLTPRATCADDPTVVRLLGPLSLVALREAWGVLAARHDSLRTAFPVRGGVAWQVIGDGAPEPLPAAVIDLTALHEISEGTLGALVGRARRPVDIVNGPAWRLLAVRLSPSEHVLVLTLHHLIADLWSVALLLGEFCTIYDAAVAGRPHGLAAPPQPVELQRREQEQRRRTRGSTPWWRRQLAGIEPLILPADQARPARPNLSAHVHEFSLDPTTSDALRALARGGGTTLFPVLLAGLGALLNRWAGQTDITVVSVAAGRRGRAAERVVGILTECLVLRVDVAGDPSFRDLVRRSSTVVLNALDHADVPFADLVALTDPGRDREPSPLRQVGLSLHNIPAGAPTLSALVIAPPPSLPPVAGASEADLWLEVFDRGGGPLGARIQLDDVMYERSSTVALERALATLLGAAAADPGRLVGELPLGWLPHAVVQARPRDVPMPAPEPSTTALVQQAVVDVLDLSCIPEPSDNFFRLGGNSLHAARLASHLSHLTGSDMGLYDLMTAPTILGIAAAADAARSRCEGEDVGEAGDPHQHLNHPLVAGAPPRR